MTRRLGVIVISGPLGSGKTTLVEHILEDFNPLQFAFIKLNVGDVSTDTKLLQTKNEGIHAIEVNRCKSCNLFSKLSFALNRAYEGASSLDGVLVETAALSHTAAIYNFFCVDQSIRERFYLNDVVAVIDPFNFLYCSNGEDSSDYPRDAFDQLDFVDKVVLNKIDNGDATDLDQVKSELKCLHPSITNIIECYCGKVDTSKLFDLTKASIACCIDEWNDNCVTNNSCDYVETLSCVCGEFEGMVNMSLLESWVKEFMIQNKGCVRCKGLLTIPGDPRKVFFQGCGRQVKLNLLEQCYERDGECVFEFIGGAFDQAFIRQRIVDCQCSQDLRFALGDRVLANVSSWKPGTVIKLWDDGNPYRIEMDDEKEYQVFAPEDTNSFVKKINSRDMTTPPGREDLRFKVGDTVYANIGHWAPGKILELFDDGNDYRIEIQDDQKTNVFAPIDCDVYVKAMPMN